MRAAAIRAGLWSLAWAVAASAGAQQVSEQPSAASRCLVVAAGAPDTPSYPPHALRANRPGKVKVRLQFGAPDTPPAVTVLESTEASFVQAVLAHVQHLRVPCLGAAEGLVSLQQDYVFAPDQPQVHWFSASDVRAAEDAKLLACHTHVQASSKPEYHWQALRAGMQGRIIASVQFNAADLPPVVTLHHRPSAKALAAGVADWAQGLRLPCHPGRAVHALMSFVFRFEDEGEFGFREVPFRGLLSATAGIGKRPLVFDTRTMGCPFDVKFWYRRPHLPNRVGELGERNPARRALLEWMESIELDLPNRLLDGVYGDHTTITVPCIQVDLQPKE